MQWQTSPCFSGTTIELSQTKDQSLTIVITGKRVNVEEARKLIVQQLQTQARREVRIPKDHHRVLIGKEVLVFLRSNALTMDGEPLAFQERKENACNNSKRKPIAAS